MDRLDLEKKCKRIVDLRTQRLRIQEDINKEVADVLAHMKLIDKKNIKVGEYSIEISKRLRREFDFAFLDELQRKGLLPLTAMKKSEFDRLLITTSKKMKLVDGKFVYETE